ncbi:hypothetical protein [Paenibacillus paeoniae]|uniref:Thioredoxin family protein n=1 Tax=Paenibacillus paeoniae TaxID=2292705 RepID=A0A371P5V3_9BACL|nr:hypothetical protein [Paenibacillus paeoniae]REK71245.1 hypothetical protein DX130_22645 [Paenibacillus paeoniae]
MKRWVLLLLLILFVCLPIVYEQDEDDLIQDMLAEESGFYHIYVFWDDKDGEGTSVPASILGPFHSEAYRQSLHISRLQIVLSNPESPNYRYAKLFDLKRSPTYLLLDHQRILLETVQIEDIPSFIKNEGVLGLSSK